MWHVQANFVSLTHSLTQSVKKNSQLATGSSLKLRFFHTRFPPPKMKEKKRCFVVYFLCRLISHALLLRFLGWCFASPFRNAGSRHGWDGVPPPVSFVEDGRKSKLICIHSISFIRSSRKRAKRKEKIRHAPTINAMQYRFVSLIFPSLVADKFQLGTARHCARFD